MNRYRHYKGGIYTVIAEEAKHTETGEWFVVYANVIGDVFIRPREMFHGYTEDGRKRFDFIGAGAIDSTETPNPEKRKTMKNHIAIDKLNNIPCIYHEGGDSLCHYIELTEDAKEAIRFAGKNDGWIEFNSLPGENGPEFDITALAFELGATGHDGRKFLIERPKVIETND